LVLKWARYVHLKWRGSLFCFKLIKPICNLKFKIFGHYFVIFQHQKDFLALHLAHSKSQKSFELILKWAIYVFSKWRGSLFGLG
jgi:hypothetical protein